MDSLPSNRLKHLLAICIDLSFHNVRLRQLNKKQLVEDLFHVKIIFHGKDKCFPKMIKETAAYEE